MAKSTNVIPSLQTLSCAQLVDWMEGNNITEHAFGVLVGHSLRNISRMTNQKAEIPTDVAVVVNLLEILSAREKNRILRELREEAHQQRNAYKRNR